MMTNEKIDEYTPKIPRCNICGKDLGRYESHLAICLNCTFDKYEKKLGV